MGRIKHSKQQAEHGILKAYETLALAEEKSRDPETNTTMPSRSEEHTSDSSHKTESRMPSSA